MFVITPDCPFKAPAPVSHDNLYCVTRKFLRASILASLLSLATLTMGSPASLACLARAISTSGLWGRQSANRNMVSRSIGSPAHSMWLELNAFLHPITKNHTNFRTKRSS